MSKAALEQGATCQSLLWSRFVNIKKQGAELVWTMQKQGVSRN